MRMDRTSFRPSLNRMALLVAACFLVSGCEHLPLLASGSGGLQATAPGAEMNGAAPRSDYMARVNEGRRLPIKFGARIPADKITSPTLALAAEGATALQDGRLEEASQLFNTALRLDLANSSLQFMNGLTYHMMALNGDAQKYTLAEQGYALAYKFDSTNPLPLYYQGLAFIDQRKFAEAKGVLTQAALMNDGDPEFLYDLARAAYYAGDPRMASAALEKLAAMKQDTVGPEKLKRASIITRAALGQTERARNELALFTADSRNADTGEFLARRVAAWERAHKEQPDLQLAQALPPRTTGGSAIPVIPGTTPRPAAGPVRSGSSGFINDEMAVVDVVIVGTQEDVGDTKGMNLLSGLELQFGDPVARTPGFSAARNNIDDRTTANSDTITRTFTRLISIPAVNYSLNIFNTLTGRNEVLARPSLVALANERSEFFSGVDVIAAAVSGGDGAPVSINKQIGVKLSVVPEFLPGERIKLKVEAERTFITSPSRSVVFNFRLDTSKTTVTANVVMKFGETLVLSGLTEKESESTRDAVPLLGDIPIIQYLFARKGTREFRKSVLILLTPRRAQFANQGATERQKVEGSLSDLEKSLARFEERNKDWFAPKSTLTEVMSSLENNALFQEFRTGDFVMERWNRRDSHEKRLNTVKDFLFY